jgi:hypothetical protein
MIIDGFRCTPDKAVGYFTDTWYGGVRNSLSP